MNEDATSILNEISVIVMWRIWKETYISRVAILIFSLYDGSHRKTEVMYYPRMYRDVWRVLYWISLALCANSFMIGRNKTATLLGLKSAFVIQFGNQ
jgi:hypothetical protein